jgi:hypothetical protein
MAAKGEEGVEDEVDTSVLSLSANVCAGENDEKNNGRNGVIK